MVKHAQRRKISITKPKSASEQDPRPRWPWRGFLQVFIAGPLTPLFRVKVSGLENIPDTPSIFCSNHVSYADSLILFAQTRRRGWKMRFMAKEEIYKIALFGWALDNAGAFPVARGTADRTALTLASKALKAGDSLVIFPEGTRVKHTAGTGDGDSGATDPDAAAALGEAHGGAAWLAIRNGVPVVPVAVAGTERIRPPGTRLIHFPRVNIHFGAPLDPDDLLPAADYAKKERIEKLTGLIMERIATALKQARAENAARA